MRSIPLLPLKNVVVFPEIIQALAVGRAQSLAAIKHALDNDREILTVLQRDPNVERPDRDDLHDIGAIATITRVEPRDGGAQVIVQGVRRVELHDLETTGDFVTVEVSDLETPSIPDEGEDRAKALALHRSVLDTARSIAEILAPQNADQIFEQAVGSIDDPITQMYRIVSIARQMELIDRQSVLEIGKTVAFFERMLELLQRELSVAEMQRDIQSQAQEGIEQQQREHMLRQQKRAIEQALGEDDGDDDIAELKAELKNAKLPDEVRTEVDRELKRLAKMSPQQADYQVARSYLELIAELPWNVVTEDTLDLDHAQTVLDEDHYGLDEIKERILESLAVLQLNPNARSSILCFVGPPGVGKTSLGQSIARAMGRKFERMSLGGLHDESELRGHRRTYIGAMPGRILQAVRRTGVRNPVLMLDEIDKLGRDFRGDPSAALMEILDPAQNKEFRDNYLNLPFDLSKVYFITTANQLDGIPPPLLDRMEVLDLSGYSEMEKLEIAKRYLVPRQRENAGLSADQLEFGNDALQRIIRRHTREAGVRELERTIGRVARKRARHVVQSLESPSKINADDLVELLGPDKFKSEKGREDLDHGVAPGLAYTATGGDVLYVEARLTQKEERVTITGQLGDVMKESIQAARSYIWSVAEDLNIDRSTIEENGIHVHVPAGAIPKDGPSAGITMATALASVYSKKKVRDDIAMTGELTLSGLVLPVGGIREKVLAAHRSGIRHVILPRDNESEFQKLPEVVRDEMTVTLVDRLEDAVRVAIPDL